VDDSFDQAAATFGAPITRVARKGDLFRRAIIAKVAMKPLSTLNRPVLETVDVVTRESAVSFKERTDVTAVPALGVVSEAMMALVLANEALRKFGGDSVEEFARNHASYIAISVRPHRPLVPANREPPHPRRSPRHRKDHGRSSARFALALRAVDTDDILAPPRACGGAVSA